MTEKERLIELLEDTLHEWECDVQSETLSQIAEHLIENGVIVPPYKVGEIVYGIEPTLAKYPISICVCDMEISTGEDYEGDYVFVYRAICQNGILKGKKFEFTNFSENVKRTKAEAEQRLAELKGGAG